MEVAQTITCRLVADVVATFGSVSLCVSGTSMVPAVLPGDVVSIERARVTEVLPGEIVVFARNGRLIAHRVTAKKGSGHEPSLVTRGDRTKRNDAVVSSSELIGRVTRIERGGRRIRPQSRFSIADKAICRLLRNSNRATSLYLRFAAPYRTPKLAAPLQ